MAEMKTKKTDASVEAFLRRVADPKQRDDCFTVLEMMKLGKHKTGVACLYVKKLADIDLATLRELVKESFAHVCKTYKVKDST